MNIVSALQKRHMLLVMGLALFVLASPRAATAETLSGPPPASAALDGAVPSVAAALSPTYYSQVSAPPTIRVARRQKCVDTHGKITTYGWNSCPSSPGKYYPDACGKVVRVDVVPFNDYAKKVLPREWLVGWHSESLKAGAMAVKTYAWYWVNQGGKYGAKGAKDICGQVTRDLGGNLVYADVDDTVNSQMYISEVAGDPRTNAAVDAVKYFRMTRQGKIFQASYRASTCSWVPDGFKLSQNGSNCWAQKGKTWDWILRYYYSGVEVSGTSRVEVDNSDSGFSRANTASSYWFYEGNAGYMFKGYRYSRNTKTDATRSGRWRSNLTCKGNWNVLTYIPWGYPTDGVAPNTRMLPWSKSARYSVNHGEATADVVVDLTANRAKWVNLGTYHFPDTPAASVYLPSNTGETAATRNIPYDIVRFSRKSCDSDMISTATPEKIVVGWSGHNASTVKAQLKSGTLPLAGRSVDFYQRPYGSTTWSYIGSEKTTAWGNATWDVNPAKNTKYRARVGPAGSYLKTHADVTVMAALKVSAILSDPTISSDTRAVLSGSAAPKHTGTKVTLQRYKSNAWIDVKSTVLSSSSTYRFSWLPPAKGAYPLRACVAAHWDHAAGCSGSRTVTVK